MIFKRHVQVGKLKVTTDKLIDRHAEAYLEAYEGDVVEFNPFERCGTSGYYIGMVWTSEFEKPNLNKLVIMGSKSLTNNAFAEVNVDGIETALSFYPGQVVAFLADPYVGKQLVARKFLDPMKISAKLKTVNTDRKITLAIACGPYMKHEIIDWTTYDQALKTIKEKEVTHAIFIGPFVDSENKLARSQFELHWKTVSDKILEYLHDHPCTIYLVPSSRDILPSNLESNCFYPTQPMNFGAPNIRKGIEVKCKIVQCMDPDQIDLGGIYVDVTSAEVLFHLNSCTTFHKKGTTNTFAALYKHILTHGIYPVYPAPPDFAVDHVQLSECANPDRPGPHIIVLPTRFAQSIGTVENRLIVTVPRCALKGSLAFIEIPKLENEGEEFHTKLNTFWESVGHATSNSASSSEETNGKISQ